MRSDSKPLTEVGVMFEGAKLVRLQMQQRCNSSDCSRIWRGRMMIRKATSRCCQHDTILDPIRTRGIEKQTSGSSFRESVRALARRQPTRIETADKRPMNANKAIK